MMPYARPGLALVASLLLAACGGSGEATSDESQTEPAPQTTTGTAPTTAGCEVGSEGCACTDGGGCDVGLVCDLMTKTCAAGAGTGTSADAVTGDPPVDTDTSTGDVDGTTGPSTGATDDTGGAACVASGDGEEDPACVAVDATRPFCVDDTCVGCGALAMEACSLATGGQRPLCLGSGACGQCEVVDALAAGQCGAEQPHCNLDNNLCEGCFEHSECPTSACKIAARTCFPPNNVLYVRQSSMGKPCSGKPGSGGSKDMPYCDFELATLAAQLEGFNNDYTFIALANDDALGDGLPAVSITGGDGQASYAFLHELGTPYDKHTQFVGIGPMISVPSNITLYINNFGVVVKNGVGDSSVGVSCMGGAVWLDDSRVLQGRGPNIRASACDLHLRRTSVAFGSTEGIDMTGGTLHAVNSFISSNMWKANFGGGGLRLRGGAEVDMVYSTIVDNSNEPNLGLADSIHCDDAVTVTLRNSVLARRPVSANSSLICPNSVLNITWSTVDTLLDPDEGDNNLEKAADALLMGLVVDNNTGVFRVNEDGDFYLDFHETARWKTGDPHFDYDMNQRNAVDGQPDYAGGDVLVK